MSDECVSKDEARKIESQLDEILAEVKKIHRGFPVDADGDVDFEGHRKYHESMIRAAEAQAEFWKELKLDIVKKGVWGLLIIVCGLVLTGLAAKLGFAELHHPVIK